MRKRRRAGWLLRLGLLLVVVATGFWAFQRLPRPGAAPLERLAQYELRGILGPEVRIEATYVDPLSGVTFRGLEVGDPRWPRAPSLTVERLVIEHDFVALASGSYLPTRVEIQSPTVFLEETDEGLRPAFPLELRTPTRRRPVPEVVVHGGHLRLRVRPDSRHFRAGRVPTLAIERLALCRAPRADRLQIEGSLRPVDMGHDDVVVTVCGWALPDLDRIELAVVWEPLRLRPALLQYLREDLAARLRARGLREGRLSVAASREPRAGEGKWSWRALFEGQIEDTQAALPDLVAVDARTRDQLAALLERAQVDLRVGEEGVELSRLTHALGRGTFSARGFVSSDGESANLEVQLRGVGADDELVPGLIGDPGRILWQEFAPRGTLDLVGNFRREPGADPAWAATASFDDAVLRYQGHPAPDGSPGGLPYAMEQAAGVIEFSHGRVELGDIQGFNGPANVRLRGYNGGLSRAWTGGETGRILSTKNGPDVRLTIEARYVPIDEDFERAVEDSELREVFAHIRPFGVIDRILADVIQEPGRDPAPVGQFRLEAKDVALRWRDLPWHLEHARGLMTLLRPPRKEGGREHRLHFEVVGTAVEHVRAEGVTGVIPKPRGEAGGTTIRGEFVRGEGGAWTLDLEVEGVPLGEDLRRQLRALFGHIEEPTEADAEDLEPSDGFTLHVQRDPGREDHVRARLGPPE